MNALLRVTILLICAVTFINALFFVGIAIVHSYEGYVQLFAGNLEDRPGINLVESLDGFLLAIVFIVFAVGFGKLFIPENRLIKAISISWLNPKSFTELKVTLWEAILTTLVVVFAISVVKNLDNMTWHILILPASILLISAGLKLMLGKH